MAAPKEHKRKGGKLRTDLPEKFTPRENVQPNREYFERVVDLFELNRKDLIRILCQDESTISYKVNKHRSITDRDFRTLSEFVLHWVETSRKHRSG